MNSQKPRWLKEKEVAEMTSRSVFTLRNERGKGVGIPYYKIGSSIYYRLDDVVNFMESNKVVPRNSSLCLA